MMSTTMVSVLRSRVKKLWFVAIAALFLTPVATCIVQSSPIAGKALTARMSWEAPSQIGPGHQVLLSLFDPTDETMANELKPATVSLVWTYDTSSWFPVWTVSLVVQHPSEAEVNPSATQRINIGTTSAPQSGHEYQMMLAYAPETGAVSVQVVNATQSRELLSKSLQLDLGLGLQAAEGVVLGGRQTMTVPVTVFDHFTPAGVVWQLTALSRSGETTYLSHQRPYVSPGDSVVLELTIPASMPGTWRILHRTGSDTTPLANIPARQGSHRVPLIQVSPHEMGPMDLRLDYVEDGQIVISQALPLISGRVEVHFSQPQFDRDSLVTTGSVQVTSASDISFTLMGNISVSEVLWNPVSLRYEEATLVGDQIRYTWPVELRDGRRTATHEFRLPIPAARSGTFKVRVDVEHDLALPIQFIVSGDAQAFTVDQSVATFSVATYNIWGTNLWPEREAALTAILREIDPDIIAFQELKPQHLATIETALPKHDRIRDRFAGWYSEGNIFWSEDSFELVEYGAEPIGIYEAWRRLFWVRLRVKATGGSILVTTAHYTWDGHARIQSEGSQPRLVMARRTIEILSGLRHPDEPVIFLGDLNESGAAIDVLRRGGLIDSVGTTNDPLQYTYPADPAMAESSAILDWQFHAGPLHVLRSRVIDFSLDGVYPSDHRPVWVLYGLLREDAGS